MKSYVYIVGAGPGDPGLLTFKAVRLLQEQAEVVVYDRLIPEEILALIPDHVERIYAGKSCKKHHMTQDEINQVLVEQAQQGKIVVRLKGGDPLIFGRGGEEAEYLHQHHIPFEIVPGISAASGISAALGVPLTHRGLATGVRFITGHQQKGEEAALDWRGLAEENTSLVIYMGLANLENITRELQAHGMSGDTPAVAVQDGTTDRQVVCSGVVADIAAKAKAMELAPPTIVIIGKVVGIARQLGRF